MQRVDEDDGSIREPDGFWLTHQTAIGGWRPKAMMEYDFGLLTNCRSKI